MTKRELTGAYEAAKERVERRGWTRNPDTRSYHGVGKVCVGLAVAEVASGDVFSQAISTLDAIVRERYGWEDKGGVVWWNDHICTSEKEAIALLDEAKERVS